MTTPNPILFRPTPSRTVQRVTAGMVAGLAALSLHVQDASAQDTADKIQPLPGWTFEPTAQTSDAQLEQEVKTLEQEVTDTKQALDEANVCVAERERAEANAAKGMNCKDVKRASEAHAKTKQRLSVAREQQLKRKRSQEKAAKYSHDR